MISTPPSVVPAISAAAYLRISNRAGKQCDAVRSRRWRAAVTCLIIGLLLAVPGYAQQSALTRHVREAVLNGQAKPLGHLPATQVMRLDIVLPLRDRAGLKAFLSEVYDPSSPSYRHFLSVAEFTARFGPSRENYDAMVAFAKAKGLTVVGGTRDGMDVQVEGSVSAVETAFRINLKTYHHPTEDRVFYAADREPVVDLPFRIWHISGLDNYSTPHTMLVSKSDYAKAHGLSAEANVSHVTTGSGPSASFLGSDMRAAYYGGTTLTGAGQNLGLFEYWGTDLADLTYYFNSIGQTNNVPISLLSVDGTSTSCMFYEDCDDTEQTLDMTQAIGMAPGLSSLVMYIGSTDTAIISAMTSNNPLPTTIGCSWSWMPADPSALDPYFERMAAQGQSFFAASGDSSTWSLSSPLTSPWPADDANVISVGGTDLTTTGAGDSWSSETAWSGSGGGISTDNIPIPEWQQLPGVINSNNLGSNTLRNGPDVSANSNSNYYTCANQQGCVANQYGGTSFATPLWAGYVALVNQQLASNGEPTIGFLNPILYAQNVTSAYNTNFHDITRGVSGSYFAVPGYDLVTGWGSPNGQNLINALAASSVSGFTLSAPPSSVNLNAGGTGTATISVDDWGGFTGTVSLSVSGLPSGVSASFNPNPTTESSVLTLTASNGAATSNSTVSVSGVSGTQTESTTLALSVVNPVQITAPSPAKFGAVNIGSSSPATPLVFTFDNGATLGGVAVLTQGAPSLDFIDAGSDTCTVNTTYSAGQNCIVNVAFTPTRPGARYGAVVLEDNFGNALVTDYVSGVGIGAQINFLPSGQSVVGSGFSNPSATAVDGSGNLYVTDQGGNSVYEVLAVNGSIPATPTILTLGSGFSTPTDLAVDGAGNVFVADNGSNSLMEILATNGSIPSAPVIRTLASGLSFLEGIAVDGGGNVYFANDGVHEILAVNGSIPQSPAIRTLGSGFLYPNGVAVDQNGNVYVADTGNNAVEEIVAVNGSVPESPAIETLGSGFNEPDGVALDANGDVYVTSLEDNEVYELLAVNGSIPASPTITTYGVGFNFPMGLTVDSLGNVYVADFGNGRVVKLEFADPPSLNFASTIASSTSIDSPQTVTVKNVGNAALSFPIPSTGSNPNIAANFTLNSSGTSACPLVSASSSTAGTLAAGASCQLLISFTPIGAGASSGALMLMDNNLNTAAPTYVTQSIALSGTGVGFTLADSPTYLSIPQGGAGSSTITVIPSTGFTGSVNLAVTSALPSGVTASFGTDPTSGTSVLTLSASSTSSLASSQAVAISGSSGALTESITILLTVYAPPDFSISTNSASGQVIEGSYGNFLVNLDPLNGFDATIALSASGLPAGDSISFSADPASGYGAYTATVVVGTNTAPGVYPITITGIGGGITHSVTYTLTIPTPDFTMTGSTVPQSIYLGQTYYSALSTSIVTSNGFNSPISLSVTGQPDGLSVNLAPNSFPAPGDGSSSATLNVDPSTVPGTYTITLTGTGGSVTHSATFIVVVLAPPVLSASASPTALTIYQGGNNTVTITTSTAGSFNDAVTLGAGGTVPGISWSFSPSSIVAPGNGSSTLTIAVASTMAPGTYSIGVVASGDGLASTMEIPLTVVPPPAFNSISVGSSSTLVPFVFTFASAVTLGSTSVLTQGAASLDFADAGGDTCVPNTSFAAGQTCSVNVIFTPILPGTRTGAVTLTDQNGNLVITGYLQGVGVGPQTTFLPGTQYPILTSALSAPTGLAIDGNENIYIADANNNRVLKETYTTAGYVESTVSSDVLQPGGVAIDGAGNVFIADTGNSRLLMETPMQGGYGESTIGSSSSFGSPLQVAVDGSGNLFAVFADFGSVVEFSSLGSYDQFTIVGNGFSNPSDLAVDGSGNIFIADSGSNSVMEISSGSTTTLLSGLSSPGGLALDGEGNLYVSDTGNDRVLEITQVSGYSTVTTLPGIYGAPNGLAVSGSRNLYVANSGSNLVTMEDFADPPNLDFAPTAIGSTSADSPQIVTVENVGNAALVFPVQSTGNNPSIATNFTLNSGGVSACPLVGSGSSTAGTLAAGASCQLPISFTPTTAGALNGSLALMDSNLNAAGPGYFAQEISLSGTGTQTTPTITWTAPAAIIYGTPLSSAQLNATSNVAGSFNYLPAAGTVLTAGQQTLVATLTPVDSTDYTTATASVPLTVNQASPILTCVTPAPILFGTPISAAMFGCTASVPGTIVYSPAIGTVPAAGSNSISIGFNPSDAADYTTASASVLLTVNKATPTITWSTPAAIILGTALSGTQLDAMASVPGTLVYNPAAGTVPGVGSDNLTVLFTPTDTADFTTATGSVLLQVNAAPSFTLGASPASLNVAQNASGQSTVTVTGQNGFTGSVTLAASGLPAGVTAAFAPNPTTGSSVLTLTASGQAAVGPATIAVKGSSGSLTANTTIALTISCIPTPITPYISVNGGSSWTEESSATVGSIFTFVDLGPQPLRGGTWSWSGPGGFTSTARQINGIPLTAGTNSYLATYTNANGCKSTETFAITVR